MKILEAGHVYELHQLDLNEGSPSCLLTFVNREPGHEHPGTQTQEVLRALIDRTMHCDNCLRWHNNDLIIYHLRMALVLHEERALERKVEKDHLAAENVKTLDEDGHFVLLASQPSADSAAYQSKSKLGSPLRPKMPDFCATKNTERTK